MTERGPTCLRTSFLFLADRDISAYQLAEKIYPFGKSLMGKDFPLRGPSQKRSARQTLIAYCLLKRRT
jgi:hypothetical protein